MDAKGTSRLGLKYVTECSSPELKRILNQLIETCDMLAPANVGDVFGSTTKQGTILRLRNQPAQPKAATTTPTATTPPFQIVDATVPGTTPVANLRVTYGLVNAITPTMDGTSLASASPPIHNLPAAGTYRVYLRLQSLAVCTVVVAIGGQPADDASNTYCTLGEVDVIASGAGFVVSAVRNARVSSFSVQSCGGTLYYWGYA